MSTLQTILGDFEYDRKQQHHKQQQWIHYVIARINSLDIRARMDIHFSSLVKAAMAANKREIIRPKSDEFSWTSDEKCWGKTVECGNQKCWWCCASNDVFWFFPQEAKELAAEYIQDWESKLPALGFSLGPSTITWSCMPNP